MEFMHLVGETITLILWTKDEEGEDEAAYLTGTIVYEDDQFSIDYSSDSKPFAIVDDWLGLIQPVNGAVRDIFPDSAYTLSLSVGDLPPMIDPRTIEDTGLQFPKKRRH